MSALNYTVFIDRVENGTKRQTIRAMRKHPFKLGERLHHFTGMRTTKCLRLRVAHQDFAKRVRDIRMTFHVRTTITTFVISLDGKPIGPSALERLWKDDGFESLRAFIAFFFKSAKPLRRNGRVFVGQVVNW